MLRVDPSIGALGETAALDEQHASELTVTGLLLLVEAGGRWRSNGMLPVQKRPLPSSPRALCRDGNSPW